MGLFWKEKNPSYIRGNTVYLVSVTSCFLPRLPSAKNGFMLQLSAWFCFLLRILAGSRIVQQVLAGSNLSHTAVSAGSKHRSLGGSHIMRTVSAVSGNYRTRLFSVFRIGTQHAGRLEPVHLDMHCLDWFLILNLVPWIYGYICMFSVHFTKGDNFCDFFWFPWLMKPCQKGVHSQKKHLLSQEQILYLKSWLPYWKGRQKWK